MYILEIILPIKNLNTLLYSINKNKKINIGCRVIIKLKNRIILGIVFKIHKTYKFKKKFKIHKILKIIDKETLITPNLWKILNICSIYYNYPLGKILISILPKKKANITNITKKHKTKKINIYKKKNKTKNTINIIKKKFKIILLICNLKTRINIYINLIKNKKIKEYKILILSPKIKSLNIIWNKINKYIKIKNYIFTSKINKKQKYIIWNFVKNNTINIIFGTRSAVFMPFKKLDLIIVDDEHSEIYKENKGWLYNAKKIAILRAKIEKIPIILSSHTPSIKSLYYYKKKKYETYKIYKKNIYIKYKILNINCNKLKYKNYNYLINEIKKNTKKKKKVLIYNNWIKYSFKIICYNCKLISKCNNCNINYTFYKKNNKIICTLCKKKKKKNTCIKCKNKNYIIKKKKEYKKDKINHLFFKNYINESNNKYLYNLKTKQIILTNKNTSKYKQTKHIKLIIFTNIDNILFSENYRSIEKFIIKYYSIINKFNSKKKQKIKIILLTKYPCNNLWNNLIKNNYVNTMLNLIKERKVINYPPYIKESAILIKYYKYHKIYNLYKKIKSFINKKSKIKIFKPKLIIKNNISIYIILIHSKSHKNIIEFINIINKKIKKNIKFKIDIDFND